MSSIRSIIDVEYIHEEEREEYYRFLEITNSEFFSDVGNHRYKINYLTLKSTINLGGLDYQGAKHRKIWVEFSNIMNSGQKNSNYANMHKAQISKMIHDSSNNNYHKMMKNISNFIKDYRSSDLQFNVVKYMYQDTYGTIGRYM